MGSTTEMARISAETELNINEPLKVILTDHGKDVLIHRIQQLDSISEDEARVVSERYRDGDYYRFQLYVFMHLFGPALPPITTMDPALRLFEYNRVVLIPDRIDVEIAAMEAMS